MSVGTTYTRSNIDSISGQIAVRLRAVVKDCEQFAEWLDTMSAEDLIALDYSQGEVDTLKSAFSQVDGLLLLARIFRGEVALPDPIDFSVPARRLSGPT